MMAKNVVGELVRWREFVGVDFCERAEVIVVEFRLQFLMWPADLKIQAIVVAVVPNAGRLEWKQFQVFLIILLSKGVDACSSRRAGEVDLALSFPVWSAAAAQQQHRATPYAS